MLYYITPVSPRTSLNLRQQFLNRSGSALAMQQREYRVPEAVSLGSLRQSSLQSVSDCRGDAHSKQKPPSGCKALFFYQPSAYYDRLIFLVF